LKMCWGAMSDNGAWLDIVDRMIRLKYVTQLPISGNSAIFRPILRMPDSILVKPIA